MPLAATYGYGALRVTYFHGNADAFQVREPGARRIDERVQQLRRDAAALESCGARKKLVGLIAGVVGLAALGLLVSAVALAAIDLGAASMVFSGVGLALAGIASAGLFVAVPLWIAGAADDAEAATLRVEVGRSPRHEPARRRVATPTFQVRL